MAFPPLAESDTKPTYCRKSAIPDGGGHYRTDVVSDGGGSIRRVESLHQQGVTP
jgi:hypothetical protein